MSSKLNAPVCPRPAIWLTRWRRITASEWVFGVVKKDAEAVCHSLSASGAAGQWTFKASPRPAM